MSEFTFTPENQREFQDILGRYPVKRACLLPTLHLVQQQEGFVSREAEQYVAEQLDLPVVDIREVLDLLFSFLHGADGTASYSRLQQS